MNPADASVGLRVSLGTDARVLVSNDASAPWTLRAHSAPAPVAGWCVLELTRKAATLDQLTEQESQEFGLILSKVSAAVREAALRVSSSAFHMEPVPSEHTNVSANKATRGVGRVAVGVALAIDCSCAVDSGVGCGFVLKLSDMQASIRTCKVFAATKAWAPHLNAPPSHAFYHDASVIILNHSPVCVVARVVGNFCVSL